MVHCTVHLDALQQAIEELYAQTERTQDVALPTTGYGGPENTVLGFTGTMFARARFIDAALQTFSRTTATVQLPLQYPVVEVAAPKRLRRV